MITKQFRRRSMIILVLFGLIFLFSLDGAILEAAEDYPTRTITIHVGFPPGGAAGPYAQVFAEGAKKYLPNPQPIIVNFKPGAASAVAADFVLKQPADGYNLLVFPWDLIVKLVKDGHELSFKMEDFIPIGTMGVIPALLAVNKEKSPFMKLEDFIDYAKKNPEKLSYGSPGIGSGHHLTGEIFMMRCGIKLSHIPFSGGGPAVVALLGGHIDCTIMAISTYGGNIKPGGGLRCLVTFTPERLPDFPDVPTCLERGYDVDRSSWYFLSAPKGTPQSIVDILEKVFRKTADDPQVKEALRRIGFVPLYLNPEETSKKAKAEHQLTREILKKMGLL